MTRATRHSYDFFDSGWALFGKRDARNLGQGQGHCLFQPNLAPHPTESAEAKLDLLHI